MALNKRITELTLRTSPNGEFKFAIYDPSTDTTNQIALSTILPDDAPDSFEWDPGTTYEEDEIVVFEDQVWISQADGNEDNPPFDGSAFWAIGVKGTNNIAPWEAAVFTSTTILKLYEITPGVWGMYYLVNATRPYNSTNFVTELAAEDWVPVGIDIFTSNPTISVPSFGKYVNGDIPDWTGLTAKQAIIDAITGVGSDVLYDDSSPVLYDDLSNVLYDS